MDIKDVRKLINYAKKNRIKTLTFGEFSVTFQDGVIFPSKASNPNQELVRKTAEIVRAVTGEPPAKEPKQQAAPDPLPGLDDINSFIYDEEDEAESA